MCHYPPLGKLHFFSRHQSGAAAIEFVFIFLIFFVIFYILIIFSFPFLLSATYQQIASEILREAITIGLSSDGNLIPANTAAALILDSSRLPTNWLIPCTDFIGFFRIDADAGTLTSCIRHPNPDTLFPRLTLPGFNLVNLPEEIRGEASIQLWQATSSLPSEGLQP